MPKCLITKIEEGKFTVLLEDMTQNDINMLCHGLADRSTVMAEAGKVCPFPGTLTVNFLSSP